MKTIVISALLMTASLSAVADSTDTQIDNIDQSKGTIVAITERGPHAVDAAHLLAIQHILHPAYKPTFMALENADLSEAESKYHLIKTDLPAFIFVDSKGIEIGRIAAGPLPAVARYVANNSAILND